MAREELPHDWMLCFDPDERVTGDIKGYLSGRARGGRRRARASCSTPI